MRNTFLDKIESTCKVVVEGKNVNNYIKRLIKDKINIISLKYNNYNKAEIIIKYEDYLKLKDMRSIYKIEIIEKYGKLKFIERIKRNYILFLSILLGLIVIIFLSKVIFSIEVIHTNKDIITLIEKELKDHGIEKYKMKKSYKQLEEIEDDILNKNKDKLEWIEIEVSGTKYIVKVEERKIKEKNDINKYQDVVMKKSGILKKIVAYSGEKVKELNTFVSSGDTVISGTITKPSGEKFYTMAKGLIYANVWYTIDVEYPYHYKEERLTGRQKEVYYISFLGKRISLFDFNKYNSFQSSPKVIFYNNIIPLSFVKEKEYEVIIIDEIYTEDEVINKAIELAESRLLSSNDKIESVDEVSIITKTNLESKIKLKLFLSVTEEVSMTKDITLENEEIQLENE